MTTVPRGIRNNNPGNIRKGQSWQGLSSTQTDPSFDQFISPQYGIRAIMKIMITYNSQGANTISKIISKWAPPNENNTQAYIDSVAQYANIDRDSIIDINDVPSWTLIIEAIIIHENGQNPYSDAVVAAGIQMAIQ